MPRRERREMGFLSHKVNRSEIEAGDHIYTWRTGFTYSHHGIYVGGNKVVHFTPERDLNLSGGFIDSPSSSPSKGFSFHFSSSCSNKVPACSDMPDCGFKKPKIGVVLSCLDCFQGGGSVHRFEYGTSTLAFIMKLRGGTCTTAKSDPPKSVIQKAMYLLHNGFGSYNVFRNNCEDFALYCKTGLLIHDQEAPGRSGQVYGILSAPLAAVLSSPLRLFISSAVGMAAAGVSTYCLSRYAADIGIRDDVIKVDVEDIFSFHGLEWQNEPSKINKYHEVSLSLDQTDTPAPKRQKYS